MISILLHLKDALPKQTPVRLLVHEVPAVGSTIDLLLPMHAMIVNGEVTEGALDAQGLYVTDVAHSIREVREQWGDPPGHEFRVSWAHEIHVYVAAEPKPPMQYVLRRHYDRLYRAACDAVDYDNQSSLSTLGNVIVGLDKEIDG